MLTPPSIATGRARCLTVGRDTAALSCPAMTPPATLDIRGLIDFALESLPHMQFADGVFCFDKEAGDPQPRGRSLRYTLMVALGLRRALGAGYTLSLDHEAIEAALWKEIDSPELDPGDYGLHLWLD